MAAVYALGASGVQIGTLFLVAEECPVPASFKQAVLDATDTSTTVTGRRNGAPVRSIKNPMIQKICRTRKRKCLQRQIRGINTWLS